MEMKGRKGVSTDQVNCNGAILSKKCKHLNDRETLGDPHHEERVGGWTMNEYTDVSGTEKAYDSGRWVGSSIKTTSFSQLVLYLEDISTSQESPKRTVIFIIEHRSLFNLHKLIPFC